MKKIYLTLFLAACILVCAWIVGAKTNLISALPGTPAPHHVKPPVVIPSPALPPHPQPDPVHVGDGSLTMTVEQSNTSVLQGSDGELFLRIGLDAAEARLKERRPLNLGLVIDRSGSMSARGKLDYAKVAAKNLIDQLDSNDRLAVVIYDNKIDVLVPSTKVTNPEAIKRKIDSITERGSTNLGGGLLRGQEEVKKYLDKEAINRVIILTDGLANQGITSLRDLSQMAAGFGEAGIQVTTMGLGAEYNEDLLAELANASGGNYYFIESPDQLAGIYEKELRTLLQAVAKDVTVSLNLGDGVKFSQAFGYTARNKGSVVEIPVGAISSGQHRKVIVRLLAPSGSVGQINIAKVQLDYQDALKNAEEVRELAQVNVECTQNVAMINKGRNVEVESEKANVMITEENKTALGYLQQGQKDKAVDWYEKKISEIKNLPPSANPAIPAQRARMENEVERLKSMPYLSPHEQSNFTKQSKLDALGYTK